MKARGGGAYRCDHAHLHVTTFMNLSKSFNLFFIFNKEKSEFTKISIEKKRIQINKKEKKNMKVLKGKKKGEKRLGFSL